jgi:hypothetical protein
MLLAMIESDVGPLQQTLVVAAHEKARFSGRSPGSRGSETGLGI